MGLGPDEWVSGGKRLLSGSGGLLVGKFGIRPGSVNFFQEFEGFADFLETGVGFFLRGGIIRWKPVGVPAFDLEFKKRVTFTRFLFVILFIYVLATIPRVALFVLSFMYALAGPGNLLFSLFRHPDSRTASEPLSKHDK